MTRFAILVAALSASLACSGPPTQNGSEPSVLEFRRPQQLTERTAGELIPTYVTGEGDDVVTLDFCLPAQDGADDHASATLLVGGPNGLRYAAAPSDKGSGVLCFERAVPVAPLVELSNEIRVARGEEPSGAATGSLPPGVTTEAIEVCAQLVTETGSPREVRCQRLIVSGGSAAAVREAEERESAILSHPWANDGWAGRDSSEAKIEPCTQWIHDIVGASLAEIDPVQAMRERLLAAVSLQNSNDFERADLCLKEAGRSSARDAAGMNDLTAMYHLQTAVQALRERDSEGTPDAELARTAQSSLRLASASFGAIASAHWIAVVDWETRHLARAGSVRLAFERLRVALDRCDDRLIHCENIDAIAPNYAWLVTLDPLASLDEMSRARRTFVKALEARDAPDHQRANALVNLAIADQLLYERAADAENLEPRSGPPRELEAARDILEEKGDAWSLSAWAELTEAQWLLSTQRHRSRNAEELNHESLERIVDMCDTFHAEQGSARIRALAADCSGQAHSLLGDWNDAAESFTKALDAFEEDSIGARTATQPQPNLRGAGLQAQAYYRLAVALVRQGRPSAAWETLAELDRGAAPTGSGAERTSEDRSLDFRIFWIDDRLVFLHREAELSPSGFERTLLRGDFIAAVHEVWGLANGSSNSGSRWQATFEPLADELFEKTEKAEGSPQIEVALYGALQSLPVEALRRSASDPSSGSTRPYLSEDRIVAVRPAATDPGVGRQHAGTARPPLIVLNPRGSIRESANWLDFFRKLFPNSTFHHKTYAPPTKAMILAELEQASFLHLATHGHYDPVFPELSELELAEGERLTFGDLSTLELDLEFSNLSACRSGRSPTSADSGHFGFGGRFTQRGARWVIATHADVRVTVVEAFNEVFYEAYAAGVSVPEAFAQAMSALRANKNYTESDWSMLMLLAAATA